MPIIIGLWPADDPVLTDADLRQMMGADAYAGSLRDMVIQAVELVRTGYLAEGEAAEADPAPP